MKKLKVFFPVPRIYGPSLHVTKSRLLEFGKDFVEETDDWIGADLIILQLIGDPDRKNLVAPQESAFSDLVKGIAENMNNIPTIVIPLCNIVNSSNWRNLFQNATMIYSYLDVKYQMTNNKGQLFPCIWNENSIVRGPLGVDPGEFFKIDDIEKQYLIYSFGYDMNTESIDILFEAVKKFNDKRGLAGLPVIKMLHSGRDFNFDSKYYEFVPPVAQSQLNEIRLRYNQSYFANALRADAWVEGGFELANIEAPLCHCQPITYNFECYSHWFKGISEFVNVPKFTDPREKSNRENVINQLVEIFERGTNGREEIYKYTVKVGEDEKTEKITNKQSFWNDRKKLIYDKFLWPDVGDNFWKEIRSRLGNA